MSCPRKMIITILIFLLTSAISFPVIGAQPAGMINYQGYLTDDAGNPLNGPYNLTFHLYNAISGGSMEWGPELHNDVSVTGGIFHVVLGSTVILHPNDFDETLFLEVQVNGENLAPRQQLQAAPYAFGLIPGAEVEGDPVQSNYALRVGNTGEGETDRGIYAKGEQYGIYAEEVGGESDVGIYSPDFVHAKGFRSNADSYFWIPGNAALLYANASSSCTLFHQATGSVRLECAGSGIVTINIPISVPGILFGQNVRIEDIRIYYKVDNTGSYISGTWLFKTTGSGTGIELVSNLTARNSTTSTSYALVPTDDELAVLSSESGPLNLVLQIQHDGSVSHDVHIAMVRVRLRHYDIP